MSTLKVNNILQEIELPVSIADILILNKVVQPQMVTIQLNGSFVLKEDYKTTLLKKDDEIDFLYFMGGGSNSYSRLK